MFTGSHTRRAAVLLSIAALVVAGTTAVSQADNYSGAKGSQGLGCQPNTAIKADNGNHTFFYIDISSGNASASTNTRQDDLNPTNIDTSMDGSESWQTDVLVRDQYYTTYCGYDWFQGPDDPDDTGTFGLSTCDDTNPADECEQHTVRLNLWLTEYYGYRAWLTCHEFGHTVGLEHDGNNASCMQRKLQSQDPETNFSGHDNIMINNHYS